MIFEGNTDSLDPASLVSGSTGLPASLVAWPGFAGPYPAAVPLPSRSLEMLPDPIRSQSAQVVLSENREPQNSMKFHGVLIVFPCTWPLGEDPGCHDDPIFKDRRLTDSIEEPIGHPLQGIHQGHHLTLCDLQRPGTLGTVDGKKPWGLNGKNV